MKKFELLTLALAVFTLTANAQKNDDFVDLGLPSGTLWSSANVGAASEEDPGLYLSWGETEPKDEYSWATYKWCNGTQSFMTKYCFDENYGQYDNIIILDNEDDAAYGDDGSCSPTAEQLAELIDKNNTTITLETINGRKGARITGNNGASIFVPAGGFKTAARLSSDNVAACLWSNGLTTSAARYIYNANVIRIGITRTGISIDARDHNGAGFVPRNYGYNIRAVKLKSDAGVDDSLIDTDAVPVKYYNASGIVISKPAQGLNIVVYSDGTCKKTIVRH